MIAARVSGRIVRFASSALLLLGGLACSGGSGASTPFGGGGGGGTPPALSNLNLWPQSAAVGDGAGSVSVTFEVDVSDADADVARIEVSVLDPAGTPVKAYKVPLANPPGQKSGRLGGQVPIPTAAVTTYTVRFQVFDSRNAGSNTLEVPFPIAQGNPVPAIASLSPASAEAGGPGFTLTVTGSDFVSGATVQWNGSWVSTTYVNATTLQAQISSWQIASAGTVAVTVMNPAPGGGTSAAQTFTVSPPTPRPVPTLTSISPSSADAGTSSVTLTVTGTGFVPSSLVQWKGWWLTTTFVDGTTLQATVPSYDLGSPGTAAVTVYTPPPGGGTTSSQTFTVTIPAQPGVTVVSLAANDLVWDPYQRKIYASVPSLSPANPNTVTVLDPFTGLLSASQFAGSEPGRLALSDDGQFLYVALGGASTVNRFTVPALTQDLSLPLGRDPLFGAYYAGDLQVAPSAPHTLAVSLFVQGVSPRAQGGMVVFDDATARPTREPGFSGSGHLFDSIQWGASASVLYAANGESSGFDLYTFSVDAAGVVLAKDYAGVFASYANAIHFDPGTGLVYGDDGHAVDPATGLTVGTFPTTAFYSRSMVPDAALGSAFFVGQTSYSSTTVTLKAYHLTQFYPTRSRDITYLAGPPRRLLRWGPDGVAFLTGSQIVLVRGPDVLPVSATANPTPTATSLAPSSVTAGGGNFKLTVTGSGFVPGSVVRWGGSDRSTSYASATELVAFIPASDVAAAGSAQVTVTSPSPGGGTSGAVTFTVN